LRLPQLLRLLALRLLALELLLLRPQGGQYPGVPNSQPFKHGN
jgi:hypothetical protein